MAVGYHVVLGIKHTSSGRAANAFNYFSSYYLFINYTYRLFLDGVCVVCECVKYKHMHV